MATTKKQKRMTCFGQTFSLNDRVCQESYETASRDSRRRATQLRKAGYDVAVFGLGVQVTDLGTIKLTMLHIQRGHNANLDDLPEENWGLLNIG